MLVQLCVLEWLASFLSGQMKHPQHVFYHVCGDASFLSCDDVSCESESSKLIKYVRLNQLNEFNIYWTIYG